MTNPFKGRESALSDPSRDLAPVVPNDAQNLPSTAVALYVETGGRVAFVTVVGQQRLVSVGNFSILPVGVTRVLSTGTTAAGIHAFTVS
ncbi:hypothetical protein [Albirhodobacter sp. R86504]|uniref:spike base protein, RCAP_Rcc01079 family n=1 Tax=Albirhodobacter sp. R86504 TaxID=3093848 RepID=UPI00366F04A9